jgi:chromate transporter
MTTPSARPQPESLKDLFFSFTLLAIQGFGGVLAYMERELVERKKWLTRAEFVEEWAVARTMPGPPALNLIIMVGSRYFGLRGAIVSVAGMFFLPSFTIALMALAYARFGTDPHVIDALRGMGAVAAGLFIATGLKLLTALKTNPLGVPLCLVLASLSFAGVALLHWRLVYVMFGLGGLGYLLTYLKLRGKP